MNSYVTETFPRKLWFQITSTYTADYGATILSQYQPDWKQGNSPVIRSGRQEYDSLCIRRIATSRGDHFTSFLCDAG
jgi:hypothetical protein